MYIPLANRPDDLGVNQFSPGGTGASETELYTLYDRPLPHFTTIFNRHVGYVGFATFLRSMGFVQGHSQPIMGHYEKPWDEDPVEIGAIVTPSSGPGSEMVITLSVDSMFPTAGKQLGVPILTSRVRENDVVELYDRTQAIVIEKDTTVTPHRITLRPLKSTVDLNGKVQVGDAYGIIGNRFAEGTGLPTTLVPRFTKYQNGFAITKEAYGGTGTSLTNAIYHEQTAGAGDSGKTYYISISQDCLRRFEMSRSHLLLFGQDSDNVTQYVAEQKMDMEVRGSEGFIEYAHTQGSVDDYSANTFAIEDFDIISARLYDERVISDDDVCQLTGRNYSVMLENVLVNYFQQDSLAHLDRLMPGYSEFYSGYHQENYGNAGDATASFGYKCIRKSGITFHQKQVDEFNDTRRVGGKNYAYRGYALTVPLGWVKNNIDGKTKSHTIGYHFKQSPDNGYSRDAVFGRVVGVGVGNSAQYGQASHDFDSMKYGMVSEIGFHGAVGNALVIQRAEA